MLNRENMGKGTIHEVRYTYVFYPSLTFLLYAFDLTTSVTLFAYVIYRWSQNKWNKEAVSDKKNIENSQYILYRKAWGYVVCVWEDKDRIHEKFWKMFTFSLRGLGVEGLYSFILKSQIIAPFSSFQNGFNHLSIPNI